MANRVGNYRIKFSATGSGVLSQWLYEDSPVLSTSEPFVGPLSSEEIDWLKGDPGVNYSLDWKFDITDKSSKDS